MPEDKGYAISAQQETVGMETGGGSPAHKNMKPKILNTPAPKDSGLATDNKKMYKSKKGEMYKGKMSY